MKTYALAAAFLALSAPAALSQAGMTGQSDTQVQAESCTDVLARLESQIDGAAGAFDGATGSISGSAGAGVSAETPSASIGAEAGTDAAAGAGDETVRPLLDQAQAALDQGDEETCLSAAAEAEAALATSIR